MLKIIIVSFIILFQWNSFAIDYGRNVLYVGGSGNGNYTSIQDAIDDAKDGDIIKVYEGIYRENIVIYKELEIIGIGKPIIEGGDIPVKIVFHDVGFSNFIIRNYNKTGIYCSSPLVCIGNNTIEGNENSTGIHLFYSSFISIYRNKIVGNRIGICCDVSKDVSIYLNKIACNHIGIFACGAESEIRLNLIENNSMGIYMRICYGNTISGNTIKENRYGIKLHDSLYNIIEANNFIKNFIHAYFEEGLKHVMFAISVINFWRGNYWDNWHFRLPKPIVGLIYYETCPYCKWFLDTLWINFDFFPADSIIQQPIFP